VKKNITRADQSERASQLMEERMRGLDQAGLATRIVDFVYAALERHGKGQRDDIELVFEFDSHEDIRRSFGGDYLLRLRA
jgi:hypothetical protein